MIGTTDLQMDTLLEKLYKAEIPPVDDLLKLCAKVLINPLVPQSYRSYH